MYRLIQVQAVNRPGVLHRITQTVFRKHYNIDNLTVIGTEDSRISLITIGIYFPRDNFEKEANLLAKQMGKQVDVVNAQVITTEANV